jgi:hypothetical protein
VTAERGNETARVIELLHATVAFVADIKRAGVVERDIDRMIEGAVVIAVAPNVELQFAV